MRRIAAMNPVARVVAVGPLSRRLLPHVAPAALSRIEMPSIHEPNAVAGWQAALGQLQSPPFPRDLSSPTFAYSGGRGQIPRYDLPFGTLRWQGTSGDRGARASTPASAAAHYYKIYMPRWAFQLKPEPT